MQNALLSRPFNGGSCEGQGSWLMVLSFLVTRVFICFAVFAETTIFEGNLGHNFSLDQ